VPFVMGVDKRARCDTVETRAQIVDPTALVRVSTRS